MGRRLSEREAFVVDRVVVRFREEAQANEAEALVPDLRPHETGSRLAPADVLPEIRRALDAEGIAFEEAEP